MERNKELAWVETKPMVAFRRLVEAREVAYAHSTHVVEARNQRQEEFQLRRFHETRECRNAKLQRDAQ